MPSLILSSASDNFVALVDGEIVSTKKILGADGVCVGYGVAFPVDAKTISYGDGPENLIGPLELPSFNYKCEFSIDSKCKCASSIKCDSCISKTMCCGQMEAVGAACDSIIVCLFRDCDPTKAESARLELVRCGRVKETDPTVLDLENCELGKMKAELDCLVPNQLYQGKLIVKFADYKIGEVVCCNRFMLKVVDTTS